MLINKNKKTQILGPFFFVFHQMAQHFFLKKLWLEKKNFNFFSIFFQNYSRWLQKDHFMGVVTIQAIVVPEPDCLKIFFKKDLATEHRMLRHQHKFFDRNTGTELSHKKVKCKKEGCNKMYSNVKSMRVHYKKKHGNN